MNHINTRPCFLFIVFLFILNSCTIEDPVDPQTGDDRDKFKGTWLFTETPAARNISYSVYITNDPSNSSQVLLRNMGNLGGSVSAYGIATSTKIVIPSQETYEGFIIEGSGSVSGTDMMEWEYTIIAGGDIESYSALATKQ
ncbi:MAG: hypothetical protein WCQ70_03155 [Lentimicrobiaceae bacterium]